MFCSRVVSQQFSFSSNKNKNNKNSQTPEKNAAKRSTAEEANTKTRNHYVAILE